ncbi:MAG TPA: hypothetical protein VK734_20355 [Bradyrhizobium sp.]|jgi:hypothetical protein|nr:hypothetical protein [Bradyrhizobium sp.]
MSERIDRRASRFPLWLRRGPSEAVAMTLIGLGVVMLMQPFSLDLFSYSFVTILVGTLGFVIVSHFPD